MIWAAWIVGAVGLAALLIALHLTWAWWRIRTHAHVEPLHIASLGISHELHQLTHELGQLAGVERPLLFVRRARLPNAFVIAAIMRPEIYLTDELLEEASLREDGDDYLIGVLCHEIAHIKLNDNVRYGFWSYLDLLGSIFHLQAFCAVSRKRITAIEREADKTANQLHGQWISTQGNASPCKDFEEQSRLSHAE